MQPKKRCVKRYIRRALIAFAPTFLLSFMFFVWGSMEVYFSNDTDFPFTYAQAVPPLFLAAFIVAFVTAAIIGLTRKRLYRLLTGIVLGTALACYVQNTFLNLDLGLLEGNDINWAAFGNHGTVNLLIFIGIILLVVIYAQVFKRKWRESALALCAVLFMMQFSAFLVGSVNNLSAQERNPRDYVLAGNEQFTLSKNENTVVFVLDYFANTYYEEAARAFPYIRDYFADFTYYNNCDPTYIGTFPSMTHLLTGARYDTSVPIGAWFEQAWNSGSANTFYDALEQNNYTTRLYSTSAKSMGLMYAEDRIDNLINVSQVENARVISHEYLFKRLLTLSCYRYLPHEFKKHFVLNTGNFSYISTVNLDNVSSVQNRANFYYTLKGGGLHLSDTDENLFVIQHLRGTHPPRYYTENFDYDEGATLAQTAAANLMLVETYIERMKELGVYDNATIIITSDHGDKDNNMQVIYFIKEPGEHKQQMAVSNAPISHLDFQGTVLKNMGLDAPGERTTIYDFPAGTMRERTVMCNAMDRHYPRVKKFNSSALGTHTAMYEYTYEGNLRELRKQVRRGPTNILPLAESFN